MGLDSLVFLALVAVSVLRSAQAWRSLLTWNLAVVLGLGLVALAQLSGVPKLPDLIYHCRIDSTIGNPSYLAAILAVMAFVATGLLVRSFLPAGGHPTAVNAGAPSTRNWLEGWGRVLWLVSGVLAIWILFQTGTRGALMGVGAGVVAMVLAPVLFNRQALRLVALAAGGLLLVVLAVFAFDLGVGLPSPAACRSSGPYGSTTTDRIIKVASGGDSGNIAVRLALADVALDGFLDRPALGWGHDNADRIYDRYAEASTYKYGVSFQDKIHNKVLGELATKGVLGTIAYLALWAVLVWAVVRRRRPRGEEVLAYAILGGLTAYFVQNLFLFDTPATALQWTLLLAWVAGQEQPTALAGVPGEIEGETSPPGRLTRFWSRWPGVPVLPRIPVPWWISADAVRAMALSAVVMALVASVYFLNYRPYAASELFLEARSPAQPMAQRLEKASRSIAIFPVPASDLRIDMFQSLITQWPSLSLKEMILASEFVSTEAEKGMKEDPQNARLIMTALPILQASVRTVGDANKLEPLLQQLRELAPERVGTHQALGRQELVRGNYRGTISIAEAFEAKAPGTERFFKIMKSVAIERLFAENQ